MVQVPETGSWVVKYVYAFFAGLCLTGLKAWQQQNVTYEKLWWIPPTSYGLSFFEWILWGLAVKYGDIGVWLSMGSGNWIGTLVAVFIHRRIRGQRS